MARVSKQLLSTIPFLGFYESIHDQGLDRALDSLCDDDRGEVISEELRSRLFDLVDWKEAHKNYAMEYAKSFAHNFNLDLKFESLQSPKYYNYSTDRVFITISLKEVKRIYKLVNKTMLRSYIVGNFSSYSGFCSSYPSNLDDWSKDLKTWDHNEIGTLLAVYAKQESLRDFDLYEEYEVLDSANEVASSVLYASFTNSQKASKLLNIARYLRQRQERSI